MTAWGLAVAFLVGALLGLLFWVVGSNLADRRGLESLQGRAGHSYAQVGRWAVIVGLGGFTCSVLVALSQQVF